MQNGKERSGEVPKFHDHLLTLQCPLSVIKSRDSFAVSLEFLRAYHLDQEMTILSSPVGSRIDAVPIDPVRRLATAP